jgi:hypothetical protein
MKLILSKILYFIGDSIAKLFYYKFFCRLSFIFYPIYSKVMILSMDLDEENKVWKVIEITDHEN